MCLFYMGIAQIAFNPPFVKRAPWGTFFGPYLHQMFFGIAELMGIMNKNERYNMYVRCSSF